MKAVIDFPLLLILTLIITIVIAVFTFMMMTGSDVTTIISGIQERVMQAFNDMVPDFATA